MLAVDRRPATPIFGLLAECCGSKGSALGWCVADGLCQHLAQLAFVFGGSRVKPDFCQLAIDTMWGCQREK